MLIAPLHLNLVDIFPILLMLLEEINQDQQDVNVEDDLMIYLLQDS